MVLIPVLEPTLHLESSLKKVCFNEHDMYMYMSMYVRIYMYMQLHSIFL